MQVINSTTTDFQTVVDQATQILRAGGLVIFPTETTYGAGVDATNQAAVDTLLAYKSRREGKPLSIAVTNEAMAAEFVELNDQARKLYKRFLPGPVTVVSRGLKVVAQGVESEFGTLGVRIPDYDLVLAIVKSLGRPITATSANGSGEKRPYTIQDIFDGLSDKQKSLIDLVIDAGKLPPNPPSTVIDTTLSTPVIFRQGGINLQTMSNEGSEGLSEAPESPANSGRVGVDKPEFSKLSLISSSEQETRDIAQRLLLKHWHDVTTTGLVIGLDGSLGAGKTIFTKGVAEFLKIKETITSPTYTYIEEYAYQRYGVQGKLYHLDVWKVESAIELERLEIDELLKPNNVVVIEWFTQVKPWLEPLFKAKNIRPLTVHITDQKAERLLRIHE